MDKDLIEVMNKVRSSGYTIYECACGETFWPDRVWHCGLCGHHWPMSREDCWNCHKFPRPEKGHVLISRSEAEIDAAMEDTE